MPAGAGRCILGPMTRVVIAGAGVAGLEAALALQRLAGGLVEIELIAADPVFTYRPAAVAEPFGLAESQRFEVQAVAEVRPGRLVEVDAPANEAVLESGERIGFDALLVACGSGARAAVPGALTFRGPPDVEAYRALLADVRSGAVADLAFAVPHGVVWELPLYELALLTAAHAAEHGRRPAITLVTPEERALDRFGPAASAATEEVLERHGITLRPSTFPIGFGGRRLSLAPHGALDTDRCVALPALTGHRIAGLPRSLDGFLEVDEHGRVDGLDRVFAAGDVTRYPVKQGGIAALQADAAAAAIAALAGAPVEPAPFRPVLRSVLMTGEGPRYLSTAEVNGHAGAVPPDERDWSPASKTAAPLLAPYLAERLAADAR
jgi:sulfide:quinone oxidoreductase